MRSSNLGTVILCMSIGLGLASVLFSNISWSVVSIAFMTIYVYGALRFSSELRRAGIEISRTSLDDMVFAGEPSAVKVEVLNKDPAPVRGTFEDVVPQDCVLADGSNVSSKVLPPRSMLTLRYSLLPEKRGQHLIPGMKVEREDAFGLFKEEQFLEQPTLINAQTNRETFDAARRMAGREHLEFSGLARNPAIVLRELEFDGIREYVPGDRARDIHWKSFTKTGQLMTKTYRKEGSLQTMVFVDCSSSMRVKDSSIAKIDHALDLSMQITNVLLASLHPAGVAAFDEVNVVSKVMPGLGRHQFESVVRTLKEVPGSSEATYGGYELANKTQSQAPIGLEAKSNRSSGEGADFLDRISSLSRRGGRKSLGVGLEGAIKDILARGKGQEKLFIVISDLVSSRDAIIAGAKLCQRSGNRMLVIHTYDDWYRGGNGTSDEHEVERMYSSLGESLRIEGALRALGATYIRIGPADTASRIVRAIRRGKT